MKNWIFLIVPIAITLYSFGISTNRAAGKTARAYLLLGQSNMAGRGKMTDDDWLVRSDRVVMLTKENSWVPAHHPLHFDKPKAAGVGPGLTFGLDMAIAYPNDTIALVPCAVGGTSINKWKPGAFDAPTNTHPYDDAVSRIKFAMTKGEICGVIWLQGESDSAADTSIKAYLGKLEVVIADVRKLTGKPKLPWVAGELGRYRERYLSFNAELHQLPQLIKHTAVISSEGLIHKGDTTHFDSKSAELYGHRFAEAMLFLSRRR